MSLERLRRYYGSGRVVALRDWSILLEAMALPLVPVGASAQEMPASQAVWATEAGTASYYGTDIKEGEPRPARDSTSAG